MNVDYVCPSCHGELTTTPVPQALHTKKGFSCTACSEHFPLRDGVPVLIWPRADTSVEDTIYSGGSIVERRSLLIRAYRLFAHRVRAAGWIDALGGVLTYFVAMIVNRGLVLASRMLRSSRVECSCCGWRGMRFGTYWDPSEVIHGFECPVCASHPRHRFFAQRLGEWIDLEAGDVLHAAPEPALEGSFRRADGSDPRITIDYVMTGVDCLTNLCNLPFANDAIPSIVCSHVLEHIEDDARAMRELFRVLRPGGVAVICVPEGDNDLTVEFGFADPKKTHHWRDYGRDVREKLETAGFQVDTVTPEHRAEDIKRFGLAAGERVHLCTKSA